jgi:predicted TIM-barrel enzyme
MSLVRFACALSLLLPTLWAQETRSTISGRVYDAQSAAVAGARIVVTHVDTNTSGALTTNGAGYYEARC